MTVGATLCGLVICSSLTPRLSSVSLWNARMFPSGIILNAICSLLFFILNYACHCSPPSEQCFMTELVAPCQYCFGNRSVFHCVIEHDLLHTPQRLILAWFFCPPCAGVEAHGVGFKVPFHNPSLLVSASG